MSRPAIQSLVALAAAAYLAASIAYFAGYPPLLAAWPWPEPGISYVFLASIAAAVAAPLAWIAINGELAALAPLSLNALVVHASSLAFLATRFAAGERNLAVALAAALLQAIVALLLLLWSRRIPVRDPRPMPTIVRGAFVVFTALLVVIGTLLVLQRPRVFPWNPGPQSSTIFGLLFLGASIYFAYGVARPKWAFAAGQLWGFLAYDIVLFIPYGRMLFGSSAAYDGYGGSADPVNVPSLVVYLTVLAFSTALALYMFFVDPRTRLGARATQNSLRSSTS